MTQPDLAADIRARLERLWDDADDRPTMAAVRAVLDLHYVRGRNIHGDPVCNECSPIRPAPCPTVRAIATALGCDQRGQT